MIIVKDLCFNFKNKKIFENLNFEIASATWVAIIGDNGSGKSTLVQILIGLLQFSSGQVLINNLELKEENLTFLRSLMGIIFQNPDYQFIGFDVRGDIAFGLENKRLHRKEIEMKIDQYSQMLKIYDLLFKKPQELSGGQKQKVAIASVLAMEPEILIFDEPTSFLDPISTQEIEKIIENIHQQKKKILITITHDLKFALKSDKIMVLNDKGKIWKYDHPLNLLKDVDFLEKYFLNLPLSLKIYYDLEKNKNSQFIDKKFIKKIKDFLWEYILKM